MLNLSDKREREGHVALQADFPCSDVFSVLKCVCDFFIGEICSSVA